MPFEHIIDHGNRLVVVRGTGEGTINETADSARRLFEDRSIGTDYAFMFVVNYITLHPTAGQMWIIVSFLERLLSQFSGRVAIVASEVGRITTANLIAFGADKGIGRLLVFPSEDQAREWLIQRTPK